MKRLNSPIQYYGGKGNMVSKLMKHVPEGGRPYCEPFCGGASLFFAREPAPVEVLNDLNGDIVNLFRCLQRKEVYEELAHRLRWTLYSRAEFCRALETLKDSASSDVDRAWAIFVAQNQGFGGHAECPGKWGRAFVSSNGVAQTCSRWITRLGNLERYRDRLMRAQIDNRDAIEVIKYWDNADAVFYVDPPYVLSTRTAGSRSVYQNEMSDDMHVRLVDALLACNGAVVLSGYDNPIYEPLASAGWRCTKHDTACHAAGRIRGSKLRGLGAALLHAKRTEVVWSNPRSVQMKQSELFNI